MSRQQEIAEMLNESNDTCEWCKGEGAHIKDTEQSFIKMVVIGTQKVTICYDCFGKEYPDNSLSAWLKIKSLKE